MRGKIFWLTTFFFLFLIGITTQGNVLALTGTCASQPNFATLVCGGTPDSVTGFGAVDVCGTCFPCGVSDGVCPEDFYSTVTQTQGSCRLCPDPDCPATISGYVFEKGNPVPNTQVVTVYNTNNQIGSRVIIDTTDVSGFYTGTIPAGFHTLFTQYGDFQSPNQELNIKRGENVEFNFSINRGSCNADCTLGSTGICSANCNGVAGCAFPSDATLGFTSNLTAQRCDGLKEGYSQVNLGIVNDVTYRLSCCTGAFSSSVVVKQEITTANPQKFKNSATWNTPVTYFDEPVKLKIVIAK